MFGIARSTAQESMLESLLTAQVYAGAPLLKAKLTKYDEVFSNPKGLAFWNGGESSARAIQSKAEEEPRKRRKCPIFYLETSTRAPGRRQKRISLIFVDFTPVCFFIFTCQPT